MPYPCANISLLISSLLASNLLSEQDSVPVFFPGRAPGGTDPSPPTHLHLQLPADQVPDSGNGVSCTGRSSTEIA